MGPVESVDRVQGDINVQRCAQRTLAAGRIGHPRGVLSVVGTKARIQEVFGRMGIVLVPALRSKRSKSSSIIAQGLREDVVGSRPSQERRCGLT